MFIKLFSKVILGICLMLLVSYQINLISEYRILLVELKNEEVISLNEYIENSANYIQNKNIEESIIIQGYKLEEDSIELIILGINSDQKDSTKIYNKDSLIVSDKLPFYSDISVTTLLKPHHLF